MAAGAAAGEAPVAVRLPFRLSATGCGPAGSSAQVTWLSAPQAEPPLAAAKVSLDLKALRVSYNAYPDSATSTNERLVILRSSPDALKVPSDRLQAREYLNDCLTTVLVLTQTLPTLQMLLNEVYLPIILQNLRSESSASKLAIAESIKSEFTASLLKFTSQVSHACQHVGGDVSLDVPSIEIDRSVDDIKSDSVAIGKMEAALHHWTPIVSQLLTREAQKSVVGRGPMAEVDYWRERASAFSSVFEQLSTPYAKRLLAVMREAVENSAATFDVLYSDLTKMYTESKDNVKFLMTLERHFKTVQHGSMTAIAEALPSMMNAIRMVWVISRHYNTDERMVPLMERIAQELSDRAVSTINIRTLFRLPPTEVIRIANEAKEVMKKWWDSYFAVRKKIEDNDRDSRWEFDKKRLFDRSSYVSMRLSDIIEAAQTLLDFRSILGPELKAVSGDNARIQEIEDSVYSRLLAPIESVPFDLFDKRFQSSWDSIMVKMKLDVVDIFSITSSALF
jgi:dynein heavy chain